MRCGAMPRSLAGHTLCVCAAVVTLAGATLVRRRGRSARHREGDQCSGACTSDGALTRDEASDRFASWEMAMSFVGTPLRLRDACNPGGYTGGAAWAPGQTSTASGGLPSCCLGHMYRQGRDLTQSCLSTAGRELLHRDGGAAGRKRLVTALAELADRRGRPARVVFLGDSVTHQLRHAVDCSVGGDAPVRTDWVPIAQMGEMERRNTSLHFGSTLRGCDVVVLQLASPHWKRFTVEPARGRFPPQRAPGQLPRVSRELMRVLHAVTGAAEERVLVVVEQTAQHFNSAGGEWPGTARALSDQRTRCAATTPEHDADNPHQWRDKEVMAAAVDAGWTVALLNHSAAVAGKAAEWRRGSPVAWWIPLYNATAHRGALHPHISYLDNWDCTHWCHTPLLWEGVMNGLAAVIDAALLSR
eukprot:TRINITY_DN6121_c0_g1_i3.p1 TRINITY_DN6121_c0_g1~~TRINITY_DN6121_c0_g1_i3.p1  ORF type:complete len:415 (+),score=84.04 TRINITY_DN6121_c0_g1_i3:31-1275(+)